MDEPAISGAAEYVIGMVTREPGQTRDSLCEKVAQITGGMRSLSTQPQQMGRFVDEAVSTGRIYLEKGQYFPRDNS